MPVPGRQLPDFVEITSSLSYAQPVQNHLRFPLIAGVLFTALSAWCAPLAHWFSDKQIQVHYAAFGVRQDLQFQLVGESPMTPVDLQVLSQRGSAWNLSAEPLRADMGDWIRRPMWVRILNGASNEIFRTPVRVTGLLDSKFADPARETGVIWQSGRPTLRVWAPTARDVKLLKFDSAKAKSPTVVPMLPEDHGFWSVTGDASWKDQFYLYRVTVFSPLSETIEVNDASDPASISLSANGARSQIVDPQDPRLMPPGWRNSPKPRLEKITDSVIYEIHLRDFTLGDPGLAPNERGTYGGLVSPSGESFRYLRELARAGLTHVHLLPVLDFAGVPEPATDRKAPLVPAGLAADSLVPQEKIGPIRHEDAYNWGYNPVHWMAPEGSYSSAPDGSRRIYEMRQLVQRMNEAGLRVVLDVVYNHTFAANLEDFSVFDRIVPYYYHRYNDRGQLMTSSCCADVATENVMVEKLILDSLVFLAREYKIDGFRFDLMNLHPTAQIARVREALETLTVRNSGIDGSKILLYAEAWPFGSLEELSPGSSFTQLRSYGWGVGVFNDRLRDAVRGGTTDPKEKSDQGFATGLFWDFNQEPANRNTPVDANGQREKLLYLGDVLKVGMAGNLRDITVRDRTNRSVRGGDLIFRGAPVGYAAEPFETITYVSAHDGYALWDAVQAKLPFHTPGRSPGTATLHDRARVQRLMLATVALSQGMPFFEGGAELLRSKSGDTDSYDSGDHFNLIDFTLTSNNWGVGLPPAWKNQADWTFWSPRLRDPALAVNPSEIADARDYFMSLLRLRRSQPLLRLSSAAEIRRMISFPVNEDVGGDVPGLVVMHVQDSLPALDPSRRALAVFVNASTLTQTFRSSALAGHTWRFPTELGPAQDPALTDAAWDSVMGRVSIPPRTVLVLEEPR